MSNEKQDRWPGPCAASGSAASGGESSTQPLFLFRHFSSLSALFDKPQNRLGRVDPATGVVMIEQRDHIGDESFQADLDIVAAAAKSAGGAESVSVGNRLAQDFHA